MPAAALKKPKGTVGLPEDLAKTSRLVAITDEPRQQDEDDAYDSIEVIADEEG